MAKYKNINTAVIHGGTSFDEYTGAVNVPIYLSSTFKQDGLGNRRRGYEYARSGNPTREALESQIAELDHGVAGFAFASGLAAISTVLNLFDSGDRILISSNVYGGTYRLLDKVWKNYGLNYSFVNTSDSQLFETQIQPDAKAVLIESPANPLLSITDIREVAKIAHKHGLTVIVDNTFMTPYLQRPLDLGADIVVYSATKYLGGHSDSVAGLVVVSTQEQKEKIAFLQNSIGAVLPPFDSYLISRGIKTLGVRLDRHVQNAEKIAAFLQQHPAVRNIYYPGLKTDPGYEINSRQARNGGAMISFELDEEKYDNKKFFSELQLIILAESLGGVESLVCHPSSMTHASIPADIRKEIGITDGLIRLSVGIEEAEDLIDDLKNAIEKSKID
ncbi:MAG: PLP-dependent aspartate aminotransferase family protein [Paludibacteraceae bacterium]|nr:PLP-dependent aspartate aminotransferase family protein [Paludibacteraceae bacterium]